MNHEEGIRFGRLNREAQQVGLENVANGLYFLALDEEKKNEEKEDNPDNSIKLFLKASIESACRFLFHTPHNLPVTGTTAAMYIQFANSLRDINIGRGLISLIPKNSDNPDLISTVEQCIRIAQEKGGDYICPPPRTLKAEDTDIESQKKEAAIKLIFEAQAKAVDIGVEVELWVEEVPSADINRFFDVNGENHVKEYSDGTAIGLVVENKKGTRQKNFLGRLEAVTVRKSQDTE